MIGLKSQVLVLQHSQVPTGSISCLGLSIRNSKRLDVISVFLGSTEFTEPGGTAHFEGLNTLVLYQVDVYSCSTECNVVLAAIIVHTLCLLCTYRGIICLVIHLFFI